LNQMHQFLLTQLSLTFKAGASTCLLLIILNVMRIEMSKECFV
jgi:hypothetical protein